MNERAAGVCLGFVICRTFNKKLSDASTFRFITAIYDIECKEQTIDVELCHEAAGRAPYSTHRVPNKTRCTDVYTTLNATEASKVLMLTCTISICIDEFQ